LALGCVAVATVLRLELASLLEQVPFLPFFLAVLVSALYAGLGPGLFATLLGLLITTWLPRMGWIDTAAIGWAPALLRFGIASVVATVLLERVRRGGRELRRERERRLTGLAELNQELRRRIEELQTLLDAAPVAIWVAHDPAARVVTGNRWARSLAGDDAAHDGEAMAPIDLASLRARVDGRELPPAELPLHHAAATGIAVRDRELELIAAGRQPAHVMLSAAPLHDEHGRVRGAIAVAMDVTARRRAEQATAELAAMVESSDDAIIGKTLDGTITSWNAAAERLYGYSAEEAIGRSIALIVPPERPDELPSILARLSRGERVEHYETERVRRDGTRVAISATISPILDGSGTVIGASAISRNITDRRRIEEALQESEERYRGIVSQAAVAIARSDLGGTLLDANPGLCEMLGIAREEVIGRNYHDVIHSDDWPRAEAAIRALLSGGSNSESLDLRYNRRDRARDGECVWVRATISLIRSADGAPRSLVSVAIDVTQRRRTEATLRFLAEASESLSELVDHRGTLQKVASLAVPDFADWCAVDMLGDDGAIERLAVAHVDPSKVALAEILHRRYPPALDASYGVPRVLRTGVSEIVSEITDAMIAATVPDEARRTILADLGLRSYMCVPLRVRERTLGVMSFVAAESGRHYDAADLAAAEDLARRAAIAIENARLYQELRESDRRKDEFLAVLSHELRNPLAPIRSGIDMLTMEGGTARPELVELMRQQVEHLIRLVDDLLDISRISRGRVELRRESVEVGDLLERSARAMLSTFERRQQRLVIERPSSPVWLDADPVRLLQVLENLLQNASKFSDAGTRIELKAERAGDEALIRVRDYGIGMDTALLSRVFQPFTQASQSIDRAQGGLGIGLALVRGLVERHGGTVVATSAGVGLGSELIVRLPLLRQTPEETPVTVMTAAIGDERRPRRQEDASEGGGSHPPRNHHPRGERRILVVDDNVAAAQMLSLLLSRLGRHQVSCAHDGPSAVERVRSDHPEIVLLDIGLPTMDGYEVGRAIRQDPAFDDVLMVALTGYGQEEDRRRSREAGFDEHLVKPPAMADIERLFVHPKLRGW
jgi:PAS domain S-box-containing protein